MTTTAILNVGIDEQLAVSDSDAISLPFDAGDEVEVSDMDVLCGKDQTYRLHKGNQLFKDKIAANQERYRTASNKMERMAITQAIVHYLQNEHHSRFLKLSPTGVWQELTDQKARDKISHALRFASVAQQKLLTSPKGTRKRRKRKSKDESGSTPKGKKRRATTKAKKQPHPATDVRQTAVSSPVTTPNSTRVAEVSPIPSENFKPTIILQAEGDTEDDLDLLVPDVVLGELSETGTVEDEESSHPILPSLPNLSIDLFDKYDRKECNATDDHLITLASRSDDDEDHQMNDDVEALLKEPFPEQWDARYFNILEGNLETTSS